MLPDDFAKQFATEWISAWNAHDLDAILSHYVDDFEMSSPVMVQMASAQADDCKASRLSVRTGKKPCN